MHDYRIITRTISILCILCYLLFETGISKGNCTHCQILGPTANVKFLQIDTCRFVRTIMHISTDESLHEYTYDQFSINESILSTGNPIYIKTFDNCFHLYNA